MKRTVFIGLFVAFALILSYVESLIPFGLGIPGIKLGLANLAVLLCLYKYGAKEALLLNITRILLAGFLFGNLYMILYSLTGGIISFCAMCFAKRLDCFTPKGVSVLGGVSHNIGQIFIAAFVVETAGVFFYIPYLIIAGMVTGWLIGVTAEALLPHLKNIERRLV